MHVLQHNRSCDMPFVIQYNPSVCRLNHRQPHVYQRDLFFPSPVESVCKAAQLKKPSISALTDQGSLHVSVSSHS